MEIGNIEEEAEQNAYFCLKTSYEYLNEDTTKRCFLLSVLYSQDHSIDAEELARYAWGLELYCNATSIEEVRSQVLEAIDHLKDSCLLLEDDGESNVKMHDMVRDVALRIASKEDNGVVIKSRVGSENESSKQNLEILLLDNYDGKTRIDFEEFRELKVLTLKASKLNESAFSLNPLKSLTNLRTLQLEGFKQLEGISALAKLTKLEILHLLGSQFQEPMDEMGELKNLRVLDMRHCKFLLGFPFNLIGMLVEVEELYLYGSMSGKKSISTVVLPQLNFLPRLASLSLEVSSLDFPQGFLFPKLQRYQLAIKTIFWKLPKQGISSRFLEISQGLPLDVIPELLWNLEFLKVSRIMEKDIKFLTDTTPGNVVPVATILQNLKDVRIVDCKNLQVIFEMKTENQALLLSELKDLYLSRLPDLKYIWKMPTQHLSLQSLGAVKIYGCGKLKSLFSFSLAQSLVRLENFEVVGCGELEQIVEESEGGEQEISPNMNLDKYLLFPKLKSLKICDCYSLKKKIPDLVAPLELPQLQELELKNCPEPTDAKVHSKGAYLEEIELSKLKEVLFTTTKYLFLRKIMDHNLVPEVDSEGLNELSVLRLCFSHSVEYLIDTTKEHVPDTAFTNLVELFLDDMDGLKMLCNGQLPRGFLQNLKKLTVSKCGKLQKVFKIDDGKNEAHLLSNLEHLELKSLPELRWILKGLPHNFCLQSLKVVNIFRCEKLKSLFSPVLIQSLLQLEELQIRSCNELKTLFAELENDDGETESSSHLHPLCLPRLITLCISNCTTLQYVLPITLAQGLPQLEKLEIKSCSELKTVFAELESEHDEVSLSPQLKQVSGVATEHDAAQHCINLPHLKHLELEYLTELNSFSPENYFIEAPALGELSVSPYPQLMEFTIEVNNNQWVHFKKNVIPNVDLEGLTTLNLKDFEDLECLADTTEEDVPTCVMFTNLVELVMEDMIGLKMLCNGQPPKDFLQNLELLRIERCMDIVSLYPVAQNLKKLTVEDSEKLEEIFRIDEFFYEREENQALLLSNLESLELESMPELRWILTGPTQYVSLRNLKVVKIEKCDNLEYLFSFSLIESLELLEELCISECEQLEMVFVVLESEDETESLHKLASAQGLPHLRELKLVGLTNLSCFGPENYLIKTPVLKNLQVTNCLRLSNFSIQQGKPLQSELPGGYNLMSDLETTELGCLIWLHIWKAPMQAILTNLRELEVYDCNRLTYIFSRMLARNLPQMRFLKIKGCEKLEQIIADDDENETGMKNENEMLMFPGLQELWLENLPSLISLSAVGYHLLFPSLVTLDIQECSQMITSFTVDSILSVHAKTKAPGPDDTCPSKPDICWTKFDEPPSLPPYVEEPTKKKMKSEH
ncbi:hypothetical protein PTKIN_Ptkin14bG0195400 [Pterospermum kingtungense]